MTWLSSRPRRGAPSARTSGFPSGKPFRVRAARPGEIRTSKGVARRVRIDEARKIWKRAFGQKAVGPADAGEDEGELADLGQGQSGDQRDPRSVAEDPDGQEDDRDLQGEHGEDERRDRQPGLPRDVRMEEHPDRDEEQAVEDVLEGQDIGDDLVAVLGFGDDHAGQERAEGEGQARATRSARPFPGRARREANRKTSRIRVETMARRRRGMRVRPTMKTAARAAALSRNRSRTAAGRDAARPRTGRGRGRSSGRWPGPEKSGCRGRSGPAGRRFRPGRPGS